MKKITLFIIVSIILFSCKKQELEGDLSYLEGKWKLILVDNTGGGHVGPPQGKDVCYLEFKKSGKIIFTNASDNVLERGRIISFTSRPSTFYPDGITYNVEIKSYPFFNKSLNNFHTIILNSTSTNPKEILTNDIVYGADGQISLVFQKI